MQDQHPNSRFLIAAAHKSSGKTVVSTGLAAALHNTGRAVQCFKKGPDYIDPMWLSAASGRACYNLDFNTMGGDALTHLTTAKSGNADVTLIEANKGLYDGVDPQGCDSNAQLAKLLKAPVILVIDTMGMTRGIAPLLMGYQAFDRDVNIAGIILNKTGGNRHEAKLRTAVETYTDIPVIGAVGRNPALDIGERHLGLTTPAETGQLAQMIDGFGRIVGASVDLDRLLTIANGAPALPRCPAPTPTGRFGGLKIGVARDASFGFYYPDDLEEFTNLGATLVPFDTIQNEKLPDIDGLFIGGGFPEMQMVPLWKNSALRTDIRDAIQAGLPTYAECGGLMYLCNSIHWQEKSYPMCGVIDGDAVMNARPQGRGYTKFTPLKTHPWGTQGETTPAHEFHYARVENLPDDTTFAREITRGHGVDGTHDGIVAHNLMAGFCHMRNTTSNPWVSRFLGFVQKIKNSQN